MGHKKVHLEAKESILINKKVALSRCIFAIDTFIFSLALGTTVMVRAIDFEMKIVVNHPFIRVGQPFSHNPLTFEMRGKAFFEAKRLADCPSTRPFSPYFGCFTIICVKSITLPRFFFNMDTWYIAGNADR